MRCAHTPRVRRSFPTLSAMSILVPVNARDVANASWLLVPLLVGPMVIPFLLWWTLYLRIETFMTVLPATMVLGPMLGGLMYWRAVRLVALGLHPVYGHSRPVSLTHAVGMVLTMTVVLWVWLALLWSVAVLSRTAIEARSFTVSSVKECSGKCMLCSQQVQLKNWVGADDAWFCASHLSPAPHIGEPMVVHGRFTDSVQYVQEFDRVRR